MSVEHPVVAVTGSSGAGTSTVKIAMEHIFRREKINPVIVEGDSFNRYNRVEMREAIKKYEAEGANLSHFGPQANLFDKIEGDFFAILGLPLIPVLDLLRRYEILSL